MIVLSLLIQIMLNIKFNVMKRKKIKPNAIEEIFCKEFEKLQRHPMDEKLTRGMMVFILSNIDNPIPEIQKEFLYKLIKKRIDVLYNYTINDWRLISFLMVLTQRPGRAVMYLTYLQYWCKNNEVKELTIDIFCEKIFPMGFPKEEDLNKLWDKQKVQGTPDNLLDYPCALQSIKF